MNKHQEKVLIATLCGLVITAAAALAVQPAMAAGERVGQSIEVTGVHNYDPVNMPHWQGGQISPTMIGSRDG